MTTQPIPANPLFRIGHWMQFAYAGGQQVDAQHPMCQGADMAWLTGDAGTRTLLLVFDNSTRTQPIYPDLQRLEHDARIAYNVKDKAGHGLVIRVLIVANSQLAPIPDRTVRTLQKAGRFSPVIVVTFDAANGTHDAATSPEKALATEFGDVLQRSSTGVPDFADRLPCTISKQGLPWATIGLLTTLVAVYISQALHQPMGDLGSGNVFELSAGDLMVQGGITTELVASGQWFRLLTAPLMHTGVIHLLMNSVALWMVGSFLERSIGKAWFLATFFVTAWVAALASSQLIDANVVSVGASGGALGLFGAGCVLAFRFPEWAGRSRILIGLLQVLIPSLMSVSFGGMQVDVAAHVAGAATGVVLGGVLYQLWPPSRVPIRGRRIAGLLAGAGIAASLFALVLAWQQRSDWDDDIAQQAIIDRWKDRLLPDERLGEFDTAFEQVAAEFPEDPRVVLMQAGTLFDQGSYAEARDKVLPLWQQYDDVIFFFPQMGLGVRAILAASHYHLGENDQARTVLGDSCNAPGTTPESHALLYDLCGRLQP